MLVGVEVEKEVLHLFDDLGDARVGTVDLVDDEDDGQALFEGLAQDEPRLGERALGGVDQQDDGVDHGEPALDLAAKVGVTRRVDDVDREAVPLDGGVLCEDGDALFALEVAGVHDPVGDLLVGREGAGLAEHFVDERGLSMVHVGDDGDISKGSAQRHGRYQATRTGVGLPQAARARWWRWLRDGGAHEVARARTKVHHRAVDLKTTPASGHRPMIRSGATRRSDRRVRRS